MADYYTELSFTVDCGSVEAADLLIQYLTLDEDSDPQLIVDAWVDKEWPSCGVSAVHDDKPEVVWIHSTGPYLDNLISALNAWCKRTKYDQVISFEWSGTCSKPRLDAFGGGAVVCYKGNAKWMNTATWVDKEVAKINARRAKAKPV
jgi:hypothetical protein